MLPLVSFVIPCYNERDYLESCLASISRQMADPASFEVIVVDNGSRDGTRELAASLGARVLLNERRGAAASRNLGAREAKGDLLAFVDADCLLAPEWLPTLSGHLAGSRTAAAAAPALPVQGDMTWVETAWAQVFVCMNRRSQSGVHCVSNLASSNLLIVKSYFDQVGGFDEALLSCEDYDLSQRLLKHGTLVLDDNVYVAHLRESKTLAELYGREIARGRFSLRCFIKNGCRLREFPSTAIPFVTLALFLALPLSLALHNTLTPALVLLLLLAMPAVYLVRSGQVPRSVKSLLLLYIVAATYVAARTVVLVKELFDMAMSKRH